MWRYASFLPLADDELPVSLGEGGTPLLDLPVLAREIGVRRLWVKDEALNPTASFKARGMSLAVTRARAAGVPGLVVPTAGNAGAALAAYAAAAGLPVRIFAPDSTPAPIVATMRCFDADLRLLAGHIGDCGRAAAAFAAESGFFNVATLREPYRAEGMKTMGLELAEQLGWRFPDAIVYPTGGGEGVIGIWKAVQELAELGWVNGSAQRPRMIVAQAAGCAPLARAHAAGADRASPWESPATHAAGLRVPGPLGDRLVLRAVRESGGDAEAAAEEDIRAATRQLARSSGIDAAPEGGCALAVAARLVRDGRLSPESEVVVFNTGAGASYRVA
jgi:threonine synthase